MTNIKPIGANFLVEVSRVGETKSGLHLPAEYSHAPSSGYILALGPKCKERLPLGTLIVWPDYGTTAPPAHIDTFMVFLIGNERARIDTDREPEIKEAWERFRKKGEDSEIICNDIDAEDQIRFAASDILDLQFGFMTQSGWKVEYSQTRQIPFLVSDKEMMLVPEKEIIAYFPPSPQDNA